MATKTKPSKKLSKRGRSTKTRANPWLWLVGLVVVLIIAVPIIVNAVNARNLPGESFRSQGNAHIGETAAHPGYNSNPPTSGWHTPGLTSWGSYDSLMPDEPLVHNLEDGGVILWYAYGTPEENEQNIQKLEAISSGYRRVVIAPRENMETPYALTAWTRLERFDTLDEAGMRAFLEAYEGIDHHVAGVG